MPTTAANFPNRSRHLALCLWAVVAVMALPGRVQAQETSKQVTLFGIRATPGSKSVDPRLSTIAPQLRKLLPGHGFKLIDAQTRRLSVGESLTCDLGKGIEAKTGLLNPLDANGKVQLRFGLSVDGLEQATIVTTPANQLFFADRPLPDGSRLLLGLGAR